MHPRTHSKTLLEMKILPSGVMTQEDELHVVACVVTKTRNHPKLTKTSQNHLQNQPKRPKTINNIP